MAFGDGGEETIERTLLGDAKTAAEHLRLCLSSRFSARLAKLDVDSTRSRLATREGERQRYLKALADTVLSSSSSELVAESSSARA
jgi:hypothetical protein